jgi:hypothetical protein
MTTEATLNLLDDLGGIKLDVHLLELAIAGVFNHADERDALTQQVMRVSDALANFEVKLDALLRPEARAA